MTKSMTAFTRQERETEWGSLSWELRSVNHRYFDVTLRLPEDLRALETKIRESLSAKIKRGKVDGTLRYQPKTTANTEFSLNRELINQLIRANEDIEGMLDNSAKTRPMDILRWPGVLQMVETDLDVVQAEVIDLLEVSLQELIDNRIREGSKLKALIEKRCTAILEQLSKVKQKLPEILVCQREKLVSRLNELKDDLDQTRLEQEMVILAQKIDVAEELDRLEVHISEIHRVLMQDEPVGRRLDFLMQELNREANTLGSKSVNTVTTAAAIELKVFIEQMREQIQNIE